MIIYLKVLTSNFVPRALFPGFGGGKSALGTRLADVLHKTSNLVISRCCFAGDGKENSLICKFATFSLMNPLAS